MPQPPAFTKFLIGEICPRQFHIKKYIIQAGACIPVYKCIQFFFTPLSFFMRAWSVPCIVYIYGHKSLSYENVLENDGLYLLCSVMLRCCCCKSRPRSENDFPPPGMGKTCSRRRKKIIVKKLYDFDLKKKWKRKADRCGVYIYIYIYLLCVSFRSAAHAG